MTKKVLLLVLGLCLLVGLTLTSCSPQKTADNFFEEGKKFYEKKEIDKAISSYNEALKLNPKMVKAYNNRGIAYVVQGKHDQAIADFNTVISMDPKNGKAYNNRAIAYYYKGDVNRAQEDIKKAQGLGIAIKMEMLEKLKQPPKSD